MAFKVFLSNLLKIDPRLMRKMRKITAPFKRAGLKKEFSCLSNNCWGGRLYDKFGKPYLSPTIGMSMSCLDFCSFVNNLEYYLTLDPVEIKEAQRKVNSEFGIYDCRLGNLILCFRHYRNSNDAIEKWNRRKTRIVYDNILVKMSYYSDDVNEEILSEYSKIPYKKILFTNLSQLSTRTDLGTVVIIPTNNNGDNEFVLSDKAIKLKKIKQIINS